MAQKNATPTKLQAQLIRKRGLDPKDFVVVKALNYTLFLKNRHTGAVKIIDKRR